jgi:uncharacterized membrane protein
METPLIVYAAYMLFFFLLVGAIILTPILAFSGDMSASYAAFSVTCHQKISRSLCIFSDGNGYWIGDCLPQTGQFVADPADRSEIRVQGGAITGYKMPVCSRDIGLYAAMLLAGAAYPFVRRLDDTEVMPAIYLIVALIPLGIDGGVQLVSELGILPFVYESTNAMRVLTGGIAGLAAAFYAIPILVNLFIPKSAPAGKGKKAAPE